MRAAIVEAPDFAEREQMAALWGKTAMLALVRSNGDQYSTSEKCWTALVKGWKAIIMKRRTSYRPEKYYMRGPGPKWREKYAQQTTH